MKRLLWLLSLLLAAGGVCTPVQAEDLAPRLDEIRWRLAGYVSAGALQPHEPAIIEEEVVNKGYTISTIPTGTATPNWCTPRKGARAFQYKPGTYRTPYPIQVAVFDDKRLVSVRAFMVGSKGCFNLVGWTSPVAAPAPPPPCKGEVEICKKLRDGRGELANHQFRLLGPNGFDAVLITDASGAAKKGDLSLGEYTLLEVPREHYKRVEPQMPYRFTLSRERQKEVVMVVNEYCPPVVQPPPPPPCKGEVEICKKLRDGRGELANHQFRLLGPNGFDAVLITDASGAAKKGDLSLGEYTLLEVPREHYKRVEPQMPYRFTLSRERQKEVVMVVNEYCPPPAPQLPDFEGTSTVPEIPVVVEAPAPPAREKSAYRTGRPSKTVDRQVVAGGGGYSRATERRVISRHNHHFIHRHRPHSKGIKTPDDDEDGDTPTGRLPPR